MRLLRRAWPPTPGPDEGDFAEVTMIGWSGKDLADVGSPIVR
jgi:hypothetical protein